MMSGSNTNTEMDRNLQNGITDEDIQVNFGQLNQSVLVFESLPGEDVVFKDDNTNIAWETKCNHAIIADVYTNNPQDRHHRNILVARNKS